MNPLILAAMSILSLGLLRPKKPRLVAFFGPSGKSYRLFVTDRIGKNPHVRVFVFGDNLPTLDYSPDPRTGLNRLIAIFETGRRMPPTELRKVLDDFRLSP